MSVLTVDDVFVHFPLSGFRIFLWKAKTEKNGVVIMIIREKRNKRGQCNVNQSIQTLHTKAMNPILNVGTSQLLWTHIKCIIHKQYRFFVSFPTTVIWVISLLYYVKCQPKQIFTSKNLPTTTITTSKTIRRTPPPPLYLVYRKFKSLSEAQKRKEMLCFFCHCQLFKRDLKQKS